MLATNPVGQISQIRRNRQKDLPRWWYLSYRYIIIVVPNPRMQNCRFSIEYHGSGIFVCYYRGYYCGNNYNASSVWPQFVLMLCLPGKNSGASERGQSIRWSPGHRDSIDTWGERGRGRAGRPDLSCPPHLSQHSQEKIEIFANINSLTEIFSRTLFSTILRSFLIFI